MIGRNIVVYHLYQAARWEQIFCEQIGALQVSGLLDNASVFICVNGRSHIPAIKNCEVIYHSQNIGEKQSLLFAQQQAQEHQDSRVLYMHSKGISHPTRNQDDWRMMMQYYLIFNWRMAIDYLRDYDVVSLNWRTHPVPHPSGNFWWTNACYLSQLTSSFLSDTDRTTHEFWLGSNSPKIANLHETELDHYNAECPPSFYTSSYFDERKRREHALSFSSRKDAIIEGKISPVFNVDYF